MRTPPEARALNVGPASNCIVAEDSFLGPKQIEVGTLASE